MKIEVKVAENDSKEILKLIKIIEIETFFFFSKMILDPTKRVDFFIDGLRRCIVCVYKTSLVESARSTIVPYIIYDLLSCIILSHV